MKTCTKCKQSKELSEFGKASRNKDGLKFRCKSCRTEEGIKYRAENQNKIKEYAELNKEKTAKQHKEYYKNNQEKIDSYQKQYYEKNKKRIIKNARESVLRNKEHIQTYKKEYYITNRAEILAGFKERAKLPERKLQHRLSGNKRIALKKSTEDGTITPQAIKDMMIEQDGKCVLCDCDIRDKYHMDHIKPLAKGGEHRLVNIQLLCPFCNISKSDKWEEAS